MQITTRPRAKRRPAGKSPIESSMDTQQNSLQCHQHHSWLKTSLRQAEDVWVRCARSKSDVPSHFPYSRSVAPPHYSRLTKLIDNGLQLLNVCVVLALVLDLLLDTLENANGGSKVVDLARSTKSSLNDLGGRHKVVCKSVVEATLQLEEVGHRSEEGAVASVELLVGLLGLVRRVADSCKLGKLTVTPTCQCCWAGDSLEGWASCETEGACCKHGFGM